MSAAFADVQDFLKALSNETRQQIVLGVFGDGLLSRAEAASADGTLRVGYERFCRFGASIRMVVEAPATADGTAAVAVDRAFVEAFAVQQVAPQPGSVRSVAEGVEYSFPARPGARVRIVFELQPVQPWLVRATVRARGDAVPLTQFVYP